MWPAKARRWRISTTCRQREKACKRQIKQQARRQWWQRPVTPETGRELKETLFFSRKTHQMYVLRIFTAMKEFMGFSTIWGFRLCTLSRKNYLNNSQLIEFGGMHFKTCNFCKCFTGIWNKSCKKVLMGFTENQLAKKPTISTGDYFGC